LQKRDGIMHRLTNVLVAVVATLTACASHGGPEDGRDDSFTADGKLDGFTCTPAEAAAILEVANTAKLTVLKNDVQLSVKAADNIVAYRTGDDEVAETSDDETFGSLAELDAVPYIGPLAFQKLLDYVHDADLVGDPPAPAGQWTSETIANGSSSDFTVTSDGKPVALFFTGAAPYKLRLPSGSVIDLPNEPMFTSSESSPQVAVDSGGVPHIFYSSAAPLATRETKHASFRNGQWSQHAPLPVGTVLVDQGPGGQVFALEHHYVSGTNYDHQSTLHTLGANGEMTAETLWTSGSEMHLNVDREGFPAIAWKKGTVRTGRRTSAGWQTRDSGLVDSVTTIATTGGANPSIAVERPLNQPALQVFRSSGATFVEGERFKHASTVYNMDATIDSLGTTHVCEITDGNVVHVMLDTTGAMTSTIVGAADHCWIGLDAAGKLHLMYSLGSVINHATYQ
jgi:hypothetical protein